MSKRHLCLTTATAVLYGAVLHIDTVWHVFLITLHLVYCCFRAN